MLTITITPRTVIHAALLAVAGVLAFLATDAAGSSDPPDSIIQGDTDCDGDVDAQDALHNLRYAGELPVGPFPNCPAIGSEAAIPGPSGPEGPPGAQGPQGEPGISDYEVVQEVWEFSGVNSGVIAVLPCPDGKSVLGGGVWRSGGFGGPAGELTYDIHDAPAEDGTAWRYEIRQYDDPLREYTVSVTCAVVAN